MKTHRFSHSVAQGGLLFALKTREGAIADRQRVRASLRNVSERLGLLDATIKVYERILFLFGMLRPTIAPLQLAEAVQAAVAPLALWEDDYILATLDSLEEEYLRGELKKWGFDYDEEKEPRHEERAAPIILRAVKELRAGRRKTAAFLTGSKAKDILAAGIDKRPGYGGLVWCDIPLILGFISQLEEIGLVKAVRVETDEYSYPVIAITEEGEKALTESKEIRLERKRPAVKPGASEEETLRLFKLGKRPEEIAALRELKVSTIYDHFVKLIAADKVRAQDVIASDIIRKVIDAKRQLGGEPRLKELKEALPEEISYVEIRCVLANKRLQDQ